jgi:hypothetical protein
VHNNALCDRPLPGRAAVRLIASKSRLRQPLPVRRMRVRVIDLFAMLPQHGTGLSPIQAESGRSAPGSGRRSMPRAIGIRLFAGRGGPAMPGSMVTVAVRPTTSSTPRGTMLGLTRTATRCARRTQLNVGLIASAFVWRCSCAPGRRKSQPLIPSRFPGCLVHLRLAAGDGGVGLPQCQFEAVGVDAEQHVAALSRLIVADHDLCDQSGHVGGDRNHVGPARGRHGSRARPDSGPTCHAR